MGRVRSESGDPCIYLAMRNRLVDSGHERGGRRIEKRVRTRDRGEELGKAQNRQI